MTTVLLVRLSAMGDVVQSLGAVAALHAARPDVRAVLVTQREFVPLVQGVPGLADVVPFERRGGMAALWRLRAALRAQRPGVAIDLQGNWKSALVARLSGARDVFGIAGPWRQEPSSRLLLRRVVAGSGSPHPARVAWDLVRELAPAAPFVWPRLFAGPPEVAHERAALAALGVDPTRPFRLVVVTDPSDARALRPERVSAWLRDADRPTMLLLGPAEANVTTPAGAVVLRHSRGELRRLVALGALVAAAGGDVLGPDQGATHVLAAAGARCRVMFGAQDPRCTVPPAARGLLHRAGPVCRPCRSTRCRHAEGPVCMAFDPDDGSLVDAGLPAEGHVERHVDGRDEGRVERS